MSKFLGPVHHWLYNKIGLQEELTSRIAAKAKEAGWKTDAEDFVKVLPPLEEAIDEGNIHGWLQNCIHDAEGRYAELVKDLVKEDGSRLEVLGDIAFALGKEHGVDSEASAQEAYQHFENVLVNGMPCDRVNMVTSQESDCFQWEQTVDIHQDYWKDCQEGSRLYYQIRNRLMEGMLADTELRVENPEENKYQICK